MPSYFMYPHLRSVLNDVSDHFARVRKLSLNLGLKFGRQIVLNEVLGWLGTVRAPSLEMLELSEPDTAGCLTMAAPRFSTRSFDSLSCLSLRNVALNWDRSELCGLSVLELDYLCEDNAPSFDELCAIARSSPGLSKLRLGGAGLRMADRRLSGANGAAAAEEIVSVDVGSLRSLEVSLLQGPNYTDRLCRSLRAPGLQSLTVSNATSEEWAMFLANTTTSSHIIASSLSNISLSSPHAPTFPRLETLTLLNTPTLITPDFAASTPHLSKLVVSCKDYTDLARFLGCVSPEKVRAATGGRDGRQDGLWTSLKEIVVHAKGVAGDVLGMGGDDGLDGLRVALARRRFSGLGEVALMVVDVAYSGEN